ALRAVVEARLRARARQQLDERPRNAREGADARREQIRRVRVVAAEQLVAALARERDLHVRRRELRYEVRGERRRVCERLVEGVCERRQEQRGVRRRPSEALDAHVTVVPDEQVSRGQLPDVTEDRERRRNRVEREERLERVEVDLAARECTQLGREGELPAGGAVVERLDPEA